MPLAAVVSAAVLDLLLLTAVLVAVCALLGQALLGLCGWTAPRWWAPVVGYALLLICGGQAVRLPGRATTVAVLIVVLSVAALALPQVRAALRARPVESVIVAVGMILLAAVPFFAAGHVGVLGTGLSDDMSQHLLGAFYLRTHDSMLPAAAVG